MKKHVGLTIRISRQPPGLIVSILLLCSCTKELTEPLSMNRQAFSGTAADSLNTLPVNLSGYNILPGSKSSGSKGTFIFHDSLLLHRETEVLYFNNEIRFTQIPVKTELLYAAISKNPYMLSKHDSVVIPKSYFITRENTRTGKTSRFIVTLIPRAGQGHPAFPDTYLDKPGFSGVIIYSDLTGKLLKVENYNRGKITNGKFYKKGDSFPAAGTGFILIYSPRVKPIPAKQGDERWVCPGCGTVYDNLPAITVVPKEEEAEDPEPDESGNTDGDERHSCEQPPDPGGGSAAGNGNNGDSATEDKEELKGPEYIVALTSNDIIKGDTYGSGRYIKEATAFIGTISAWGHRFTFWNGNVLPGEPFQEITITSHITATAHFDLLPQCISGNKANPLGIMRLEPPKGTNIPGATFGETRRNEDGSPKKHKGIDLAGPVGTPVYAMFDGEIGPKYITGQPDKIGKHYPDGYTGDKNDAGNRIYIESTLEGKSVMIGYTHLRAGNPVAINPRTGRPFVPGDHVYQGDVIGYIGHTGNASPEFPHLHITIYENGIIINPVKYLNATIQTTTALISTPCNH